MDVIKEFIVWPANFALKLLGSFGPNTKSAIYEFYGLFDGWMRYIVGIVLYILMIYGGAEGADSLKKKNKSEE